MVQKDPGSVEAQIPEPPGGCRAVTHRGHCTSCQDTCPSVARGHRDASRPPAIHLKGDADGGTLQLFYLKKRRKKHPTTQRTKPITKRNSGSLCLLSVLFEGVATPSLPWDPVLCTATSLPPGLVDRLHHQLSTVQPSRLWSCWGQGLGSCLWAFSALR